LGPAQQAALARVLAEAIGPGAQPRMAATLPLGAEDELARHLPADLAPDVAVLFAASATPEREAHGAFVRALADKVAGRATLAVLVDESGLRQRTGLASDAELRVTQRRAAWQRLLHDLSLPPPRFVDLG
jgi:calcineurin-like phosphoesterase